MTPEQIEQLMTDSGLEWQRIVKNMWAITDPAGQLPRITISVEASEKKGSRLLKFIAFICDVPANSPPEFFKEFLRNNFAVEHGTYAMETRGEMSFMDTLELDCLDANEFAATLAAMQQAPAMFKKKFNMDAYTFGSALY